MILQVSAQEFAPVETTKSGKDTLSQAEAQYEASGAGATEAEAAGEAFRNLCYAIADKIAPSFFSAKINLKQENPTAVIARILETFREDLEMEIKVSRELASTGIQITQALAKSAFQNILAKRKKLVYDMYANALAHQQSRNINEALKLYYFCIILANSIPEEFVRYNDPNLNNDLNLTAALPDRITKILDSLSFSIQKDYKDFDGSRKVVLKADFSAAPVTAVELCYLDAAGYACAEGKDGIVTFELTREIRAVGELWNLVAKPEFANRRRAALSTVIPPPLSSDFSLTLTRPPDCSAHKEIERTTSKFLQLLQAPDSLRIKAFCGEDDFLLEKIQRLLRYNHTSILERDIRAKIDSTAAGWEVRRITVLNRYPTINKRAVEHLILDFTKEGKLVDINFSIYDGLYAKFVAEANDMQDWKKRQTIIKFVEKYRTAYLNRDLNTMGAIPESW